MLSLDEFIAATLKSIIDGVKEAQDYAASHDAKVNPPKTKVSMGRRERHEVEPGGTIVDFDVALATREGTEKKGGVGVFLASCGVGAQAQSETAFSSTSRVRFSLQVVPPVQWSDAER